MSTILIFRQSNTKGWRESDANLLNLILISRHLGTSLGCFWFFTKLWSFHTELLLIFIHLECLCFLNILLISFSWLMSVSDLLLILTFPVVVNLYTGYYKKGYLIMKRRHIMCWYLKSWFALDFIASFPYSWVISDVTHIDLDKEAIAMSTR